MATESSPEEETRDESADQSKRARIINALAVYPERFDPNSELIADLTDASRSYVYRIREQLESGDLDQSEVDDIYDDELQQQYREQLDSLLDEYDVDRSLDEEPTTEEQQANQKEEAPVEERGAGASSDRAPDDTEVQATDSAEHLEDQAPEREAVEPQQPQEAPAETADGPIAVEQVEAVREQLVQYRRDAEFEREQFESHAADIAHEKYYIASRAIDLLDELIDGAHTNQ